ncbi:helix-turn-helix domain-containing protein [Pseudomonas nitroreducens]|uniref:helix-turn-helix domain-containing protein n=1 Tax=Pseudomonas nitroreducens TaxID=46680 RepID=UPI00265AF770|nr:AraC family transcriptional regulator [Pseudomonas nitroreducens]MCP1649796.1 AraC-like DNA-binding protein [Pseudomonas nitroreducens]MCP1687476.1 AraC-like DNA-binding protein [Pseudomonas nitroreducens]
MSPAAAPPSNAFYAPTLLPAVEELLARGIAAAELEACMRRPLLELRTPLVRVPLFLSRRFWDLAERASGETAIGLLAGKRFVSTLTNGLTYLFDVAPTLEAACTYFAEYFPYFNGSLRVELRAQGEQVALVLSECGALLSGRQSREYTVVGICSLLRRKLLASGVAQDALLGIQLPGHAPAHTELYAQALRAPLHWRSDTTEVVLHLQPALFRQPLSPANPELEAILVGIVEAARGQTQRTLLDEATEHIASTLAEGASFQSFCRTRHLTERTAARRLLSQGWRYSELLDEQRRYKALDLLSVAELSLAQITDQLGYGDLQSFSRAFGRWYDSSPGAWREAQLR